MRTHDSDYKIHVTYDDENQEFVARFRGAHSSKRYGAGGSKAEALLNLIENSSDSELDA